ncbi:hypothetical protein [Parabacteroides goldsteinii]|uniref:hypothetical protein n=1 Tax=Parabacteroides goldsteinii TaxID=328812 RepID=UPI00259B5F39|nr:hypothetical protein [Parabacteroides goldsteinii]
MNESSITIRWEKNADGGTDISVSGDINYQTHFREAFLSLDNMPPLHDITERETSGESAGKSATIALLTQLIAIIRKSDKTNGQIITEQMRNSKFPLTDLVAIRKFAEIAGIKFDEQKFRNWREFRMYFQSLLKQV